VSPSVAYRAALVLFTVKDRGRLAATRNRCSVLDQQGKTIFIGNWHDAYRVRRLEAAKQAARALGCFDCLDLDMHNSPIDHTWIKRLAAAQAEQSA
jgi:hypothetical protein